MKLHFYKIVCLSFLLLLVSSCDESSDPVYTTPLGSISGSVVVYDSLGLLVTDKSGVTVELNIHNTSYKTQTDQEGNWKINNLPAAVYNGKIYKDGDTVLIDDFQFVGNGELKIGNFTLKKPLDIRVESLQITNPKLIFDLSHKSIKVSFDYDITINSPTNKWVAIFFSRYDNPSPNNFDFIANFSVSGPNAKLNYDRLYLTNNHQFISANFDTTISNYYYSAGSHGGVLTTTKHITFEKSNRW